MAYYDGRDLFVPCREEVEEMILGMANVVLENRTLRDELDYYKGLVEQHRKDIDRRYNETMSYTANIINSLVDECIESENNIKE